MIQTVHHEEPLILSEKHIRFLGIDSVECIPSFPIRLSQTQPKPTQKAASHQMQLQPRRQSLNFDRNFLQVPRNNPYYTH